MLSKIFGKWTHEPVKLDYSQVTEGLNKVSRILAQAKCLRDVEVAENMFVKFCHMFSTPQERESSHIIYGIQQAINEQRAKFEASSEVPYTNEPLKFMAAR
ncbi:hypothetical protein [Stenotrophomonas phage RAS14]